MTILSDSMQKLLAQRGLLPPASTSAASQPAIDISKMDELSASMRKVLPAHQRGAYDQNWLRSTLARDASASRAPIPSAAVSILHTDTEKNITACLSAARAPAPLPVPKALAAAAAPAANIQPATTAATSKARPSIPTYDDVGLIRKFSADIKTLPEQEALKRRDEMLVKIKGLYPELASYIAPEPVSEWATCFVMWQAAHELREKPRSLI